MKLTRWVLGVVALAAVAVPSAGAQLSRPDAAKTPAAKVAASPAHWKPWYLTSADQFRLKAPPAAGSAQTKAELKQLLLLQKKRTPARIVTIKKWNAQPAVIPWTETLLAMIVNFRPRPPVASRAMALFETALYDAMIAAYDSQEAYAKSRPRPSKLDKRIKPALKVTGPSYAPMDAAIAGAAETMLAFLFPGEPKRTFTGLANEAVNSCLFAGTNYRSDVQNARTLGQKVAALAIARARSDNFTSTTLPNPTLTGEGYWASTPPAFEPFIGGPVGTWKTWLMPKGSTLRGVIPGPSAYGSPAFMRELKGVFDTNLRLTDEQRQIANFWDDGPGTDTPGGHWFRIGIQVLKSYKTKGPQATRIFSLLSTVEADAVIAAWEAKYYWWSIRPITGIWRANQDVTALSTQAQCNANPALCPWRNKWYSIITTPGFPSYPSGHSTFSGGAGRLLTYFFPRAGQTLNELANQAAASRLYGGIHFEEDNRDGLILGRAVADLAIARAKSDGSGLTP